MRNLKSAQIEVPGFKFDGYLVGVVLSIHVSGHGGVPVVLRLECAPPRIDDHESPEQPLGDYHELRQNGFASKARIIEPVLYRYKIVSGNDGLVRIQVPAAWTLAPVFQLSMRQHVLGVRLSGKHIPTVSLVMQHITDHGRLPADIPTIRPLAHEGKRLGNFRVRISI